MEPADSTSPRPSPRAVHRLSSQGVRTSVISAVSLFAATALSQVIELVLKAANPSDVDVTQGLAYLRPLLIISVVLLIIAVGVTVAAIRRLVVAEGAAAARLPWILFAAQAVTWLVYILARGALGPVVDG